MARQLRLQLPGVPFHITARAQGKAPIFLGIEGTVCGFMNAAGARSDARLLAFAVMPNHLHVVLLQGDEPLHAFMQPLLRRIALLVQSRTGVEGHVFERRFRCSPCLEPEYLRNAIAYVHLNAQRAGLCAGVDYDWCTHGLYCSLPELGTDAARPELEQIIRLFALHDGQTVRECLADYHRFLKWRMQADARIAGGNLARLPERPGTFGGDCHWLRAFGAAAFRLRPERSRLQIDLRDLARYTLADVAPDMDLDLLRSGGRGKALVRIRRTFIKRARCSGHAVSAIARFLRVSPTTVSAASPHP